MINHPLPCRLTLAALLGAAILAPAATIWTQEAQPAAEQPAGPQPVSPADIPARSTAVLDRLREADRELDESEAYRRVADALPSLVDRIDTDEAGLQDSIDEGTALRELVDTRLMWLDRRTGLTDAYRRLESRWRQLQATREEIAGLSQTWEATRSSLETDSNLLEVVDSVLTSIEIERRRLRARLDAVLELQSRIADQQDRVTAALDRLENLEDEARRQLFNREAPPLWQVLGGTEEQVRADSLATWNRRLDAC